MWWFAVRFGARYAWRGAKLGYKVAQTGWWLVKRNVKTYTSVPKNAVDWTWVMIEATPWYLFYRKHKDTIHPFIQHGREQQNLVVPFK